MRRLLVAVAVLFLATPLFAHREDFIGETLVFLTLPARSIEPELFVDAARGFRMYNAALEYGVTSQFMIDGRASWDQHGSLDSARLEGRRRFGEEGAWPVDVAVSVEGNFETEEGERRYGVEPRLILSKDIKRLNITLNLAEELPTQGGDSAFRFASGIRFDVTEPVRLGTEFQYDFHTRSGSVIPQLWIALPHELTIKGGYSAGFHGSRHFARVAIEFEF